MAVEIEQPHLPCTKWKRVDAHDESKRTVVAFGDGSFSPTMRGKIAGVSRVLLRALRRHDRLGHLVLVSVPEFRSSRVCSRCQGMFLENVRDRGDTLHAVLRCKNCDTTWNRDVNAARNLRAIALYMSTHKDAVPEIFERPKPVSNP